MKPLKALITALLLSSCSFLFAQDCKMECLANIVTPADKGKEGAVINYSAAYTQGACGAFSYTPASGSFFRMGSHSVIATGADGKKCSFTITVTDNESPELSPIRLSRTNLWPASNKMKKTKVKFSATDNGGNVTTAIAVSSNATDGIKDWEIIDEGELRLKASRLSDGSPRIYTITVTATDDAGNKTKRTTTIAVSETMIAKTVPAP
jgi:hypothetical protein